MQRKHPARGTACIRLTIREFCGRSNSAPMSSSPSRQRQYYGSTSSFYYDSYSTTVCTPLPVCGYERGGGAAPCWFLLRRRNCAALTVSRSSRISSGILDTVDDDREDEDNDKAINGGGDVGETKASNLVWRLLPLGGDEDDDDEDAGFLFRSQ